MKQVRIGELVVGAGSPAVLVAEIGINHNGDMDIARRSIDAAKRAGATSVKFQNYRTSDFLGDRTLTYEYISQGKTVVESQYDMFKRCELSSEQTVELKRYCDSAGILFHSTPTNAEGVADLVRAGTPLLKNGSDYLTDVELVAEMGKTGLPTVISTGMATIGEIADAVSAFRSTGNNALILLHCTSQYPAPPEDLHLRKIIALAEAFDCLTGFSDHSEGYAAAVSAVTLGACWIEKHFTLDRNLPGPDHRFSSDEKEFAELVRAVRNVEAALTPAPLGATVVEDVNRREYRLSCQMRRPLRAGHVISREDLAFRRPGTGLPPKMASAIVGRALARDVSENHIIRLEDLTS